uniref:Mediator of RNA polymerase II transcription subunit 33A n=2 Tax=Kalanchoe fedtschenkoi TaxID=63787 RepID=A0A7N0V9N6_KALFE
MAAVERLVGAFGVLDSVSMDIDSNGSHRLLGNDRREQMRRTNPSKAMEVLCQLTGNRQAMVLLRLVKLNMAKTFRSLLRRIQFLEVHKARSNLQSTIEILSSNIRRVVDFKYHLKKRQLTGMLVDIETEKSFSCNNVIHGQSACWVSYDIYMESALDGKQLPITSAVGILKGTICTLQVFNRASWHETFLALWLSALRLVQRERDPPEGPIPHLECRLCVLLSIVPLTIAKVINDEAEIDLSSLQNNSNSNLSSKQQGLVSSLQNIGQFTGLLCPPPSVVGAANNAAAKAANFVSGSKNVNMGMRGSGHNDMNLKAGGNLRHLIVEACIARNLLDSSAYLWPGYVPTPAISPGEASPTQRSPWLTFMEGAPLKGSLIGALISTPASSVMEIDKLYQVALNGNEEERPAAAKILCGASLSHGWNIQEHVVNCVVKLLSPPVPSKFSGVGSHLLEYTSMLSALLFGTSSIDTVHILSLHGVIPEVAAALLPLCEAFGSLVPTSTHHSSETSTIYMVFSSAFLFLLRLWKFYRPPFEQCVSGRGAIGGDLTLEFLLLLRNSRISAHNSGSSDGMRSDSTSHVPVPDKLVYIDSYPKLRAWYCQNKSCIASTLSGLCSGNPVHQVANDIISMIYFRINKKGSSASNLSATSSGSLSESPASTGEDTYQRPLLPAWEVLEAMPFVLEALLTACAYGRLSSRDLTTGLRDLIDFLPASLAAIISYFSAEVTRGLWKPVLMNGTDWPSPAANFSSVESELKQILAAVDVKVPSFSGISSAMLPLPMAALVSLTITFKLDKSLEYIHAVAGPALENCASSCPWPSMSIVGSLWAQKVKRWHDFIVVSCTRSVIQQNKDAVAQLLRSCFTSFLGPLQVSDAPLGTQTGISGLLGNLISARGVRPSIQPGFLYLRTCRLIQNVQYVNGVIVHLVSECSQKLGAKQVRKEAARLKSSRASLALATAKAKEIATLGASLLCITGGPSLVQELYQETIPTWLLSAREETGSEVSAVSRIIEGYTMAYLVVLSGSFVWGLGTKLPSWAFLRRAHILRAHLDFVAEVLEGNVSLGCHPATWKAYVSCLVGLIVSLTPLWIKEVKVETLKKLSSGLRGWRECELALSLLERGGAAAMGTVAELMNVISS